MDEGMEAGFSIEGDEQAPQPQKSRSRRARGSRRGSVGNALMVGIDVINGDAPEPLESPGSPTTAPVTVAVGSRNPVKLSSAEAAFKLLLPRAPEVAVQGFAAASGVPDQPMGDSETKAGALNRATAAYEMFQERNGCTPTYAVGMEGGIADDGSAMDCFAWMCIYDGARQGTAKTASFQLPQRIAELVRSGMELGAADDIVFGTKNNKQGDGTVGHLTKSLLSRTDYYTPAVLLAFIPFSYPELYA